MSKFYLIICLTLFFSSYKIRAQISLDSINKIYEGRPDTLKAKAYLEIASSIQNKNYKQCLVLCDEIIRLGKNSNRLNIQAEANLLKGLTNYFAGEYDQTLSFYLLSIQQFEQCNQLEGKAKVLNELGIFYRRQKNDSNAFKSFQEAYAIANEKGNEGIMATALNNQGILYQDKGEHDQAIQLFSQARTIYEKIKDTIGISYTMDYASVSFAKQNQFQQAIDLQTKALDIRLHLLDSNAAALSLINLAEISEMQNDPDQSKKYLLSCLEIAKKIKYKDLTATCYQKLSKIYADQGKTKEAYDYHVQFAQLQDEIFNEKRSKQISELQTKYETEKSARQIESLQAENTLKETRNKNQFIVLISILIISLISFLAFYHFIKRKKQKELDAAIIHEKEIRSRAIIEAEEKERVRIARDLHDGVAQTMVAAKMQLEDYLGDQNILDPRNASLQNAFDLIKDASNEVRSISHSMIPNALLKSGLVAAVRDFVHRIGNEKLKINLEVTGLNNRIDSGVETVIFRVLQELVNNIIKHAKASEITIQLFREKNELSLIVEDNGVGFDISKLTEKSGMGLKNIESRVEYLNGTVHFDSTVSRGTTVIVEIPISEDSYQ